MPRKEASSLARARPGGAALPVTHETVEELTIVTYDGIRMHVRAVGEERLRELAARDGRVGEIYAGLERLRNRYEEEIRRRFPKLKARPPGVNLDDLLPENGFHLAKALVDSGDTCVEIVEATVRVTQLPEQAALVTFKARDAVETAKLVTRANRHEPAKVRALDGMLLVEFRGETENEARERAAALVEELRRDAGTPPASVAFDGEHRNRVWLSYVSAVTGLGLVDAAIVPPEHLPSFVENLQALLREHFRDERLYGDFGSGCVRAAIGEELFPAAAHLTARFGGVFVPQRNDPDRARELERTFYGEKLADALVEFRLVWDPLQRAAARR